MIFIFLPKRIKGPKLTIGEEIYWGIFIASFVVMLSVGGLSDVGILKAMIWYFKWFYGEYLIIGVLILIFKR